MNHFVAGTARRAGIFVVAAVSVIAGGAALWGQLNPDSLADARTIDLLMVLALLVLPAATGVGLLLERRQRATSRRATQVDAPPNPRPAAPREPAIPAARTHPGAAVARRDRLAAHAVRRQDPRPSRVEVRAESQAPRAR